MSGILDCLRWVSAVAVLVCHTANLMVARFAATPTPFRSAALYLWTFSAGFGHQAVTTFFVLSGFLVGGPLVAIVQRDGQIPWKKYLVDRLVRIQLVLIPALILTYLFDRITFMIRPEWVRQFIQFHSGWEIFFGNLLSLQNFFIVFFGSDGPIGTLAMEMWYYLSFPLLLAAFCRNYSFRKRFGFVIVAIVINVALGWAQPPYLLGFLIWGAGVSARLWKGAFIARPLIATSFFLMASLCIRLVMRREMSMIVWELFLSDLVLAVPLHMMLVSFLHSPEAEKPSMFWGFHKRMAGFSYSLYAIHMPFLFLLTGASSYFFGFGVEDIVQHSSQWALVFAVILSCLVVAYVFSLLTEHHTNSVRKWVFRAVSR
jgi:peptidoglycan/LPS O-acetylase OafA/YrhL